MSTITDSYIQAELALAAYSNLTAGISGKDYTDALKDNGKGMTSVQAADFASKWSVVGTPYNDPVTGVYAVVFQEVSTGQRYLAIRGTEGVTDYLADYFILDGVPSQLNPQYLSLKTQVQAWMADPAVLQGQSFTVSGHSLGGYLAAGLVADFSADISHAYLYNAPGNNSAISLVMQALGIAATPDATQITSLRADAGISPIASLGYDFSPPIPITIENQFFSDVSNPPPAMNHSQQVLTDALAVYALFSELSPTLTVEQIGAILKASTAKNAQTLESTVGELSQFILGTNPAIAIDDRESLYTAIKNLTDSITALSLTGKFTLVSPPSSIAEARTDLGAFLSLHYLTPFALKPVDAGATNTLYQLHATIADQWNDDRNLTPEQIANGEANFSDIYLADRAAMLSWIIKANTDDTESPDGITTEFIDHETNKTVGTGTGAGAAFNNPSVIFGDYHPESITGGIKNDDLFGGGGDDQLFGLDGNDYLEGNDGNDTLYGDAGNDILIGGKGADLLNGGAGSDTLIGGLGNDTLDGGTDANILNGGLGNDTYYIQTGAGNTNQIIETREADGKLHGTLYVNGKKQGSLDPDISVAAGGLFFQAPNGDTSWTYKGSAGLTLTIGHHSPWKITLEDGSVIDLGDFQDGDYGIRLLDNQIAAGTFDRTITGDLNPVDQNDQGFTPVGWDSGGKRWPANNVFYREVA